jgi:hypothetical protein
MHYRSSWILKTTTEKPPLWIQRLQEYNFTCEHSHGSLNFHARIVYHCQCAVARADIKQIRAVVSVASVGWDPAALKTEQLSDRYIGPILEDVEVG